MSYNWHRCIVYWQLDIKYKDCKDREVKNIACRELADHYASCDECKTGKKNDS